MVSLTCIKRTIFRVKNDYFKRVCAAGFVNTPQSGQICGAE